MAKSFTQTYREQKRLDNFTDTFYAEKRKQKKLKRTAVVLSALAVMAVVCKKS